MKNAKDMLINSVKLTAQGLKGIEVKYTLDEKRNSRSFPDEYTAKKKAPIHDDLNDLFISLKPYVLDIFGFSEDTREMNLYEVEMTGITYNNKGFILSAKKTVLEGNKVATLITPLITEDDSEQYSEICSILDKIYEETRLYMAGDKTITDEQLVMKMSKNDESFDLDSFSKLSKEEKRERATKILESMGSIVTHVDELEIVEEEIEEVEEFEEIEEDQSAESLKIIDKEDGGFKVVKMEAPKSTAKKAAA